MDGSSSGIGMANTDLRLKSYFGPQSGLRVEATEKRYSVRFFIEDQKIKNGSTIDHAHDTNTTLQMETQITY
jgi:hypothetical protein